jgi:hypothetical protein
MQGGILPDILREELLETGKCRDALLPRRELTRARP